MCRLVASMVLMNSATAAFASTALPQLKTLSPVGIGFANIVLARRNKK